ncbi:MAG: hypothetical protein A2475_02610 [Ignavibacteria bacterium RIFOXYC2_FULL_35_21]|nr:MAG: hypothetical protein A2220_00125 [Ignavibacteria bacterium RIFOXYA2_FULL_35_10]OGV19328.1 MAG: hypothetical protein A2475_02610 [Ignavibacteria bacterium RIFOXYC2_FULL_35_21]
MLIMDENNNINPENEKLAEQLSDILRNQKEQEQISKIVASKVESTSFTDEVSESTKQFFIKPAFRYSIAAVLVLFAVTVLFFYIMPNQKQRTIAKKQDSTLIKKSIDKYQPDSVSLTKKRDSVIEPKVKNLQVPNEYANENKYKIWEKTDSQTRAFGKFKIDTAKDYNLLDSYSIPMGRYGSGFHDSLKNILKSLGYEVTETKNGEGRTALETEPQSAYFSKFKNDIPYKIRIENGKEKSIKVKLFEQQKNKNIKIPKSKSSVDELYYKELRDRLEKSFKNK